MASDNDTKPRASIFKNKKVLYILIPISVLLCCGSFIILGMIGLSLPPQLQLKSPDQATSTSSQPSQNIKLSCINPQIVTINEKNLSRDEIDNQLCGLQGYTVSLNNGTNTFKIISKNTKDEQATLDLNISFDKSAYEAKIAEQQSQKLKDEQQKQAEAEKKNAAEETKKNKPRIGDSLLGPSYKDIKTEFEKQQKLSSYKGDQYLESLQGEEIIWVGEIGDVKEEWIGDDLYIAVHLNTGIIQDQLAYVENPRKEDLTLNKGTKVKVTATISKVQNLLGLSVYLNHATLEQID